MNTPPPQASATRALRPGVTLALLLTLAGCGSGGDVEVIRLGHGLDVGHPVHRAMEEMARRVDEGSAGALRIEIHPSEQLGTERECLELLQIGSLGMTTVSAAVMENFASAYRVFSVPYLFRDEPHRFAVMDGAIWT